MSLNTRNELMALAMTALHFPVSKICKASTLSETAVLSMKRQFAHQIFIKTPRSRNCKNEEKRLARWASEQPPLTRTVLNSFLMEYARAADEHVLGEVNWDAFFEAYEIVRLRFGRFGKISALLDPFYASRFASEYDGKRIRIVKCPECGLLRAEFSMEVYGPCMRRCAHCYWFLHSRKYLMLRRRFWPFFNRALISISERAFRR